jgi:glycosyltransferase involved in cell wall biosynthesis
MWFLAKIMVRCRRNYDIIHVVDLDTGIIGVPLGRLLGKFIIYDAFDHIAAMVGEGFFGRLLASVERVMIKKATIAIFPDPIRLTQYGIPLTGAVSIVGNIPDLPDARRQPRKMADGRLRLVYIGTLEATHRGLEYLTDLAKSHPDSLEVIVGGMGELHEYFERESARIPNLSYLGQLAYDEAWRQMEQADLLYGPYLLTNPAHRYASPNKMYEHLALGIPLITSSGTPPAELVTASGSGFVFDGSYYNLDSIMSGIRKLDCLEAGQRAATAWKRDFSNLRPQQLNSFFTRLHAASKHL